MNTKTPQFDKALDGYFSKLELDEKGGQERVCRFSKKRFYIRPDDIAFYKKMGVPLPTLEPEERRRRRISYHNSYELFKNISAFSGKRVVTMYPPGSPFKFYEHQIWYSDKWDPLEYARDYDITQPFFDAFHAFQLEVPRSNLISDPSNVNSDYTNVSKNLKNCYIVFDQNKGEDLYYHQCCADDRNCVECWAIDYSDTCYECKMSRHLYKCFFCEQCRDCMESYFLWDCRNCQHCFMSSNLRNKKYYFRNEYIGKEEYVKRMKEIYLGDYYKLKELVKEYSALKEKALRKPNWNEKSVNVIGDFIDNSKNVYYGLYVTNSENIAYSEGPDSSRDSYDVMGGENSELGYEISNVWAGDNYSCKFSFQIDNCREVEYCDSCRNCRNCFGCVGLKNKKFCIFNKQYSEDDYWKKIDEFKTAMLSQGEYGEFFPPQYSPFPYRVSMSISFQGFRDYENAGRYGYDISPVKKQQDTVEGEIVKASELPSDVKDVNDDILDKIIFDEKNNKYFRLIQQELAFYRMHKLPLPREHPSVRMQRWRDTFNVRLEFYERKCPKCGKNFQASYVPESKEIVYCEPCYQNEVV